MEISYSKINLFQSCPKQYYFRYIAGVPEKQFKWPGTLVGEIFHLAIEEAITKKNSGITTSAILKYFKDYFETAYIKKTEEYKDSYKKSREFSLDPERFFKQHQKMLLSVVEFALKYFYEYDNNLHGKNLLVEHEFLVDYDFAEDIKVRGFIDLYHADENGHKIFDLKITNKPEQYYYVDWDETTQKLIYEYYIYKTHGVMPEAFSYIVFNREDKVLFMKEKFFDDRDFNADKYFLPLTNQIESVRNYILKPDETLANPEKTKCNFCSYNKQCNLSWIDPMVAKTQKILKGKNK